jgi:NADH:ubiquinone oxidoreductase subunit H
MERKLKPAYKTASAQWLQGPQASFSHLADFIKLLTKEDIEPRDAKKLLFRYAPLAAFAIMIFAMLFHTHNGPSVLSTGTSISTRVLTAT